jgi:hypothetical protein
LKRVLTEGQDPEPLQAAAYGPTLFAEVLGVDDDMAFRLYQTFGRGVTPEELKAVPGMTDALLERIQGCFVFKSESEAGI